MKDKLTLPQLGRRARAAYDSLLADIRRGVYPAGTRLPPESELCVRLDLGRDTVRKALAQLATAGYIATRHGSGSVVQPQAVTTQSVVSLMFAGQMDKLTLVQDQALEHGLVLSFFSQMRQWWTPTAEAAFLQRVLEQRHRGLLAFCSPLPPHNDDLLAELVRAGIRVVHIEHYRETLPAEEYLLPDYRAAGYLAATSLLAAGHEHVAYVAQDSDGPWARLIASGVHAAVSDQRAAAGPARYPVYFSMPKFGIDNQAQAEARTSAFFAALPPSAGVVVNSVQRADVLRQQLAAMTGPRPTTCTVLGIETLNDWGLNPADAAVRFGWGQLFTRALATVAEPGAPPLHELLPPRLVPALASA